MIKSNTVPAVNDSIEIIARWGFDNIYAYSKKVSNTCSTAVLEK